MSVNEILSDKSEQVNNKTSKYCNNCEAKDIKEINIKGITDNYGQKTEVPSYLNSKEKLKMHYLKLTLILSNILSYLVNFIIFKDTTIATINTIISVMYSLPIFFYSSRYEPPLALGNVPCDYNYDESVSIVIPNKSTIDDVDDAIINTRMTLESLKWFKGQVIVVDDSPSPIWNLLSEQIYSKYSEYIILKRIEPKGKKAGALNSVLFGDRFINTLGNYCEFQLSTKFVFILDSDFTLNSEAREMFKIARLTENIGAVIACPRYRNGSIWTAFGNGSYKFFQILMRGSIPLSMGSLTLYSAKALREINGFNCSTSTEDTKTSIDLYQKGYKQVLVDFLPGYGLGPECFISVCMQFSRWARGSGWLLIDYLRNLKYKGIPLKIKIRIFSFLTWYFGIILNIILSLIIAIFWKENIKAILLGIIPLLFGFLAYGLCLKKAGLNKKEIFAMVFVWFLLAPILGVYFTLGIFEGLLKKNQPFVVTPKSNIKKLSKYHLTFAYLLTLIIFLFLI
jgi:cellulose synthase/poly-beta-1,6-N-acetylglucosamine synthase-like glycosyltransferase